MRQDQILKTLKQGSQMDLNESMRSFPP